MVYDESKTEVEEEVFDFLLKKQDIGVLEICLTRGPDSSGESLITGYPNMF